MDMSHSSFACPKDAKGTATKQRRAKSRARRAKETATMNAVRAERACQIPACPCTARGVAPEIAHRRHRGSGGNPAGDRTVPADLFALCRWRHKGSKVSLDRKTLLMVGDGAAAVPFVRMDALPADVLEAVGEPHLVQDGRRWIRAEVAPVARWLREEWRR